MKIPHFDILMGVGQKYYPDPSFFIEEAMRLGVSKRIAEFPPFYCPLRNKLWLVHWGTRKIFGFVTSLRIRMFVDNDDPLCKAEKERRAKFCGCDSPACIICAKFGDLPGDDVERGCGHLRPSKTAKYVRAQYLDGGTFLEDLKSLRNSLRGPWEKLKYRVKALRDLIQYYMRILVRIPRNVKSFWDPDQLYYTAKALALFKLMSRKDATIEYRDNHVYLHGNPFCDIYVLYRAIPYTGSFTRGYRYIRVDLEKCKYTIIKIKVKKKKEKQRKERSLLDYTSYNTKRVFPLKQDKQYIRINTPSSVLPGDDDE